MKKSLLFLAGALLSLAVIAQPKNKQSVVIGRMTTKENALLILNPPNSDQGVILPQLTTAQRLALSPSSPSEDGLTVFDTNAKSYFFWSEGKWVRTLAENTAKIRYYSIDPSAFQELKPDNNTRHTNITVFDTDNTFVTASRSDGAGQMMVPVTLPDGAAMRELTVYYMDNGNDNLTVKLLRKNLSGNNEEILSWQSSGSSANIAHQTLTSFNGTEVINNEIYSYRLLVIFELGTADPITDPSQATQRIYGAKIKYQE
jgi:hypothetical protein